MIGLDISRAIMLKAISPPTVRSPSSTDSVPKNSTMAVAILDTNSPAVEAVTPSILASKAVLA